uniref:Uncharacterized protein n=1 Tax=Meloidogyne enterolobii TaxID=390850 RepID=A0A6V7VGT6_MELEN|nr:unnamed protein product [Meloidogyne enterolobii]
MRTPKQLEEWSFSTQNSDNIKNKIEDETLVEEEDNFTETSSIDGLTTISSSCCSTQNINGSLKQHLKKLEFKMEKKDLSLEKSIFDLQKKIQEINSENENDIKNLKQNIQQLKSENNQKDEKINSLEEEIKKEILQINSEHEKEIEILKAANEENLKQKNDKINYFEEEINKLHKQSNDLIKLQTNFNNLQLKSIEEEERVLIWKKIQKINSEHKNEIEEIKNNFQKLKDEIVRKDEKINSLEEEIKKANDLTDKKFGDLFNFNNLNSVVSLLNNLVFVKIKNKWKEIGSDWKCCDNNCINTNKPIGNCIEGNGFVNLIDDENIKYLVGKRGYDKGILFMQKFYSKSH